MLLVLSACSGATDTVTPFAGESSSTTSPSPDTTSPGTSDPTSLPSSTSSTTTIVPPSSPDPDGFDDHTVPVIASRDAFFSLAQDDPSGRSVLKFNLPALLDGGEVNWMDSNFFRFHDEWYWFRLLNGREVPSIDTRPVDGLSFSTIDEIYDWTEGRGELPLNLNFFDERLADNNFYRESIDTPRRNYILGSVVHVPARTNAEEF